MRLYDVHPANLRDGDRLCDTDGHPFTTITGEPGYDDTGFWVHTTTGLPVHFPHGTTADVLR